MPSQNERHADTLPWLQTGFISRLASCTASEGVLCSPCVRMDRLVQIIVEVRVLHDILDE